MQKETELLPVLRWIEINHAFIIFNEAMELLNLNQSARELFGLSAADTDTDTFLANFSQHFGKSSIDDLRDKKLFLEKQTDPAEYWVSTWFSYEQNDTKFHFISLKDITEIVNTINARSQFEQEQRYRFLFDNVPVPLWEEDFSEFLAYLEQLKSEGVDDLEVYFRENPDESAKFLNKVKILDVNQCCIEKNGVRDKEELLGKLEESLMTKSKEMIIEENVALIKGETRFEGETSRVTLDGRRLDMRVQLQIPEQYKKNWQRVLVSTQDITKTKQAEIALKQMVAQNKQLMRAITSILIQIDAKRRVMHWNQKASDVLGLQMEDVVHMNISDCEIAWDNKRVMDGVQQCEIFHKQVLLDDIYFTRKTGGEGYLGITLNPILDEDEETYMGCLLLGADITDRKLMETQLLQAQKLESIGQLAAGIAHEINTPTQYIGDNTRFLKESYDDLQTTIDAMNSLIEKMKAAKALPEAVSELEQVVEDVDLAYLMEEIPLAVEQSLEGIQRVSTIVKAMKEFSHPGSTEKTPTDINHAIDNTLTVARNEWKYIAEVERDYEENLPLVPCLPGEFNQVILNLVTNAAHAISKALAEHPGELGRIRVQTRKKEEVIEIQISDSGTGIPEKIRNKVFDPFFTTKEVGKGTGQGLTIAYNVIVEKHGGNLTYETEIGKGTTFIIELPLQAKGV